MPETTPILSDELKDALTSEYQDEHPETWYDPRILDIDSL